MEIKTATDFAPICISLTREIHFVGINKDLLRYLVNIGTMVDSLSKQEVECRRMHNYKNLIEPLAKINASIHHLEQLLFVARLMK
jgi:hypothetical protein